jgi:hypothetical protein
MGGKFYQLFFLTSTFAVSSILPTGKVFLVRDFGFQHTRVYVGYGRPNVRKIPIWNGFRLRKHYPSGKMAKLFTQKTFRLPVYRSCVRFIKGNCKNRVSNGFGFFIFLLSFFLSCLRSNLLHHFNEN